jgi:hypothetical protein
MSRLTGQKRASAHRGSMAAIKAWAFRGKRFRLFPFGSPFKEFASQNRDFRGRVDAESNNPWLDGDDLNRNSQTRQDDFFLQTA